MKGVVKLAGQFQMNWKHWSKFSLERSGHNPEKPEEHSLGNWKKRHIAAEANLGYYFK
ncbi:hypothetical protein Tco_0551231, partial [Tanacetum coccineum]